VLTACTSVLVPLWWLVPAKMRWIKEVEEDPSFLLLMYSNSSKITILECLCCWSTKESLRTMLFKSALSLDLTTKCSNPACDFFSQNTKLGSHHSLFLFAFFFTNGIAPPPNHILIRKQTFDNGRRQPYLSHWSATSTPSPTLATAFRLFFYPIDRFQ
jgi:hypothetical protein